MLVMANFELVPALRQFVNAMVNSPRPLIGEKLPISIRKRSSGHQTIVIFPEDGYNAFVSGEFERILVCAKVFNCSVFFTSLGGVPVIEVSSWIF